LQRAGNKWNPGQMNNLEQMELPTSKRSPKQEACDALDLNYQPHAERWKSRNLRNRGNADA
jgi:hypothetical protein